MSNLIKAYSVRYAENVKKVDMNNRADEYQQEFLDKYLAANAALSQLGYDPNFPEGEGEEGQAEFVPGLFAENLSLDQAVDSEGQLAAQLGDGELEARRQELEELEARIAELRQESDTILDEARAEAERIFTETRAGAEAEKIAILNSAYDEAYAKAVADAQTMLAAKTAELDEQIRANKEEYEKQVRDLEPAFVEMVLKYVKKLTGIYEESKRDIIMYLLDSMLQGRVPAQDFIIRVSSEDYPRVSEAKPELEAIVDGKAGFELVEDKLLEPNHCMIETEARLFDCSLEESLNALIEDIKLLAER